MLLTANHLDGGGNSHGISSLKLVAEFQIRYLTGNMNNSDIQDGHGFCTALRKNFTEEDC